MKFVIRTFRRVFDENGEVSSLKLVKETKCGDLPHALSVWMRAQTDFSVDKISVEVEKWR